VHDALPTGKLPPALLRELLEAGAALPPEVRLGPRLGEDACAIEVPGGALVAASDPITLTGSGVGAHAVVINANDVAAMGVRPRWFLATALFPVGTRADDVRVFFAEMREALRAADVALVGGHTEVTDAVTQTVVVGQMLGMAPEGRFVPTGGARPGHAIVQVGPAPVEGAAVLAREAAARLGALDARVRERAAAALARPGTTPRRAASPAASTSWPRPRACASRCATRPCSGSSRGSRCAPRSVRIRGERWLQARCWRPSLRSARSPPAARSRKRCPRASSDTPRRAAA
jgi:hypothetical protein